MDVQSLGYAAGVFQEDPRVIRAALRGIKAEPAMTINGVEHFRTDDVVKAIAWLLAADAERKVKTAAEAAG